MLNVMLNFWCYSIVWLFKVMHIIEQSAPEDK